MITDIDKMLKDLNLIKDGVLSDPKSGMERLQEFVSKNMGNVPEESRAFLNSAMNEAMSGKMTIADLDKFRENVDKHASRTHSK